MDSIDSYDSTLIKIKEGKDKRGKYKLMELHRELPCECHPETCCCSGKRTRVSRYKLYKDGSKVSVS